MVMVNMSMFLLTYLLTQLLKYPLLTDGDAVMVNMSSRASLPLYKFHSRVHNISFSPDGKLVTHFLQCIFFAGAIFPVLFSSQSANKCLMS